MKQNISMKPKMVFIFLCLVINILSLKLVHTASWNSYLESIVAQSNDSIGKPHCDKAGIIGLDDGELWYDLSAPYALQITSNEAQKIAQAMKSGDFSSMQADGILVEGVKYLFLR